MHDVIFEIQYENHIYELEYGYTEIEKASLSKLRKDPTHHNEKTITGEHFVLWRKKDDPEMDAWDWVMIIEKNKDDDLFDRIKKQEKLSNNEALKLSIKNREAMLVIKKWLSGQASKPLISGKKKNIFSFRYKK